MNLVSQAGPPQELAARSESGPHAGASTRPSPAQPPRCIHDLRELFKVKVVAMVLVTGWGGFYLGSMQSGISSVQRGLLETLLGIGLVSAGAGALNEALERKIDARMKRTADRPLAAGRFSLAQGILAGLGALALGAVWPGSHHQPAHRGPGAADGIYLRRHLHAAQALHHPGHIHRRISRRHGPHAGLDRRARTHRVAGRGAVRHSLCLAVPSLHGHRLALSRRLRPRRHPHVARRPARRLVHRGRGAVLRRGHDSRQPGALVAGHGRHCLMPFWPPRWAWFIWPIPSASPAFCAPTSETESRMLARDLLKVSVLYLPLLFTTLMLCATAKH